jgi:protein involved in polysaccharide export with SLBB domain
MTDMPAPESRQPEDGRDVGVPASAQRRGTMSGAARKWLGVVLLGVMAGGLVLFVAANKGLVNLSILKNLQTYPTKLVERIQAATQAENAVAKTAEQPATTGLRDESALPALPPSPALSPASGDRNGQAFHIGDKLRIAFYERLEFEEEKWGRQRSPRPAFQQRMEFTGEYTVNDDGTISLPLLGSFAIAKRSSHELEAALAGAIEILIGRKGFATISALERQPIYVLGPVKNPGAYKYASGMTVLHALALAGGLDRTTIEPWQRIEAVRETGKWNGAIERTTRLLARLAVIKSEHDGSSVQTPPRLVELVGEREARRAIEEQIERRRPVVSARLSRHTAVKATFDNARSEVESLAERIPSLDENVRLRAERVDSMRSLTKSNIVASPVLIQAQSELSDVQERRQSALTSIALAKQRLALAEQDMARQQVEAQTELEREITVIQQDIADGERELHASEGILKVIKTGSASRATAVNEANVTYEVVRRAAQGATVIAGAGTTMLEPGDLVRIRQSNEADARPSEAAAR